MERPSGLVSHARLMETAAKPILSQRLAMGGAGVVCKPPTFYVRRRRRWQVLKAYFGEMTTQMQTNETMQHFNKVNMGPYFNCLVNER